MEIINKKILLSGGGTGGSVSPLLAICESLKKEYEFFWVGTKNGIEKKMVGAEKIPYYSVSSGKFRRYFSIRNFIDPFFVLIGFFQSLGLLLNLRPDMVITAGSFVSVPVVWAARLLRIPVLVHQQDIRPGLANKLMAPFAKVITVTFEKSLKDYGKKAVLTGSPARQSLQNPNSKFQIPNEFSEGLPVIFILGGGTGAKAINDLVYESMSEITKFCNVIHQTGKNKIANRKSPIINCVSFDFLNPPQMAAAYAEADLVVSRAGMGTLTELSYFGKPAIIIPMPDSHQEENAEILKNANAAIVLNQRKLSSDKFISEIKKLLTNDNLKSELSANIKKIIRTDADEIIKTIKAIIPAQL